MVHTRAAYEPIDRKIQTVKYATEVPSDINTSIFACDYVVLYKHLHKRFTDIELNWGCQDQLKPWIHENLRCINP